MKKIITLFTITAIFSSCSFFSNAAKDAANTSYLLALT